MFSLDNFYYILYTNLLEPVKFNSNYFYPFGSTDYKNILYNFSDHRVSKKNQFLSKREVLFYDQEPLIDKLVNKLRFTNTQLLSFKSLKLLANSEHSTFKKEYCRQNNFINWYYFFHGFAALDWYRDFQYFPLVDNSITKLFISYNRLVTKDRSYRLLFASHLMNENLLDKGLISLSLMDHGQGTWQDELNYDETKLPINTIPFIKEHISKLTGSLVIDYENPQGNLSAVFSYRSIEQNQNALWHIVTETVFYYEKLHLTEKIFKPIVHRRPFMLLGAPGNLAYLKSYGFKTFDRWIDESYDYEIDHNKRIEMVVNELKKLSRLSITELNLMYEEMKEILEYNFNHMYGQFKKIIVDELVDNFEGCLRQWNNGQFEDRIVDTNLINFDKVKQLLLR